MSAQPAYHSPVDHVPRVLAHGLPVDGQLTTDGLSTFPDDPFWTYELLAGALLVSSDEHQITWDDLQTFPDLPNWRYELSQGCLIVTPNAPGARHQSCAGSLYLVLRHACPPGLKVMIAPFEYTPDSVESWQPDLLIMSRPVPQKRLTRAPILLVEVLSPSTRGIDETLKRSNYQAHGVEHYWLVDPKGPAINAFRLLDGEYAQVATAGPGEKFEVSEPLAVSFDPLMLLDE